MENIIREFDTKNTTIIISSYPDRTHGIKDLNAIAWYSKKTFEKIASNDKKFVVLAEVINEPEIYKDGEILVIRCWKRNSPLLFWNLINWVKKFPKILSVLIEFEFNIYGGVLTTGLFPLFLGILKLQNKKIIFELHQVVLDVNTLSGHLNIKKYGFMSIFFNFSLSVFYKMLCLFSDRIIVLEEELRQRLLKFACFSKISVIPIAVSDIYAPNKQTARRQLKINKKEFVLLYFGYISWYKGADWLVKVISKYGDRLGNKKIKLILAGGKSTTLHKERYYKDFYENIQKLASSCLNIDISGFVEDKDVPKYFAACDLVVLPYRTFMSSSGPLSFACSFNKPFVMSEALSGYFLSPDFVYAVNKSGITKEDILFPFNFSAFIKKMKVLMESKESLEKLSKFTYHLSKKRTVCHAVSSYNNIIDEVNFADNYKLELTANVPRLERKSTAIT